MRTTIIILAAIISLAVSNSCNNDSLGLDENIRKKLLDTAEVIAVKTIQADSSSLLFYEYETDKSDTAKNAFYGYYDSAMSVGKFSVALDTSALIPIIWMDLSFENPEKKDSTSRDFWIKSLRLKLDSIPASGIYNLDTFADGPLWSSLTLQLIKPEMKVIPYYGKDSQVSIVFAKFHKTPSEIVIEADISATIEPIEYPDKKIQLFGHLIIIYLID